MAEDHGTAAEQPAAPEPAGEDAKARFREALSRKQDAAHRSSEGRQNTGVVHGSEITGASKRTFRRKTG